MVVAMPWSWPCSWSWSCVTFDFVSPWLQPQVILSVFFPIDFQFLDAHLGAARHPHRKPPQRLVERLVVIGTDWLQSRHQRCRRVDDLQPRALVLSLTTASKQKRSASTSTLASCSNSR